MAAEAAIISPETVVGQAPYSAVGDGLEAVSAAGEGEVAGAEVEV